LSGDFKLTRVGSGYSVYVILVQDGSG